MDKSEYERFCNIFTEYLDETKNYFFINMNIKIILNLFSQKKLKNQPRT